MSPLSVQVHVTCAVCWAPAQCCCQPTGVWPSKTLLHVKMWPPSLLQRSSRAALPPQGAQSKRLEWSCRWTRTCFYLSSSVCIINLFFFPSDGCVFFGDDSLLVRWFSSTSKPGISSFKLKLISLHILSSCASATFICSRSAWVQSWRACCWACARTQWWGGLTCWRCWRPASFTTRPQCCPPQSASSGSWLTMSTETQWVDCCLVLIDCILVWADHWCLYRLITCPWLKMDPSLQTAVKWSGIDCTVKNLFRLTFCEMFVFTVLLRA